MEQYHHHAPQPPPRQNALQLADYIGLTIAIAVGVFLGLVATLTLIGHIAAHGTGLDLGS